MTQNRPPDGLPRPQWVDIAAPAKGCRTPAAAPASNPVERGRVLGAGFAQLTGKAPTMAAIDLQDAFLGAVRRGANEACERDEVAEALAHDCDYLRSLGFGSPNE
jgi:hypothetical protein